MIEQAKGIVMQRYQLDQGAAFQLLVRWSQGNNTKLREVCQLVVDLVTDPAPFEVLLVALQQQALEKLRSQASGRGRPAGPPA